ncbi:MAG TPA: hypothetical protein DDX91_04130 [Ruminococcaceae bacterium]|nr:hypothetical protein [Oscillospiraceae bacterium]
MKLLSLMFCELRISRKGIILQFGLMLAWIALTWGMLLSLASNGSAKEELLTTSDVIIMMTALIGAMPLLLDEVFKADINSGWLIYSYALPITPLERTAARFFRRALICIAGTAISLCGGAAICAYVGKPFGANYFVWHMVVIAAMIIGSLPNNIFTLRVRNRSEIKKAQTAAGLTVTGLLAVTAVVIFLAGGADLLKPDGSGLLFRLPVFTAGALVWAVPLLIAAMAASFFTAYHSLRTACRNTAKTKKDTAEISLTPLPAKAKGITGLLYKELKQNRTMLILAAICPLLLTAFPFCFSAIDFIAKGAGTDKLFEAPTNSIIRMLMCACGIFAASGLMSELFKGDDKKLWTYFIVTTPHGVRGFLYHKYVITLIMNLIYMIFGLFSDKLLETLNYIVTGKELAASMQSFYTWGVFVLMVISAFDIPFTVRYGSKKGSMVKMTVMLLLCTAGVTVFSLLSDGDRKKIVDFAVWFINGNGSSISAVIKSLIPFIALAMFCFSYRISCRVFMKGVNEYVK